jgi:hypothetical protein
LSIVRLILPSQLGWRKRVQPFSGKRIRSLNSVQREVLIDLQAPLALVAGDQLDLRVRQAMPRQVGQHLVPE